MKPPGEFAAHAAELLSPPGSVVARRLFGGHGPYRDGTRPALIAGGILDLMAGYANRALSSPPARRGPCTARANAAT